MSAFITEKIFFPYNTRNIISASAAWLDAKAPILIYGGKNTHLHMLKVGHKL